MTRITRDDALPITVAGTVVAAAFMMLLWEEIHHPLRRKTRPKAKRQIRNVAIAGLGALTVAVAETPLIEPLARVVAERRWGLLGRVNLPLWAEVSGALLCMDYTFYVWHVLLHRVPLLWRFHAVHHIDLDMDASTALRFHSGELLISIPWRAAQVLAIGLTPLTFSVWQVWFALCVMFQHSNVALPLKWERRINRLLVTPRMHGIHHSDAQEDTNSNWSSGLTVWDWLHGTLRLNVPQQAITIGVPAYSEARAAALPRLLAMPFEKQPNYWRYPDGSASSSHAVTATPGQLLS